MSFSDDRYASYPSSGCLWFTCHANISISSSDNESRTKASTKLSPADDRNPVYHILRAGFPYPDRTFFENEVNGMMTAPTYSNATFVTGFNLKVGDWYTLRNEMIESLHQRDLLDNERLKPAIEFATYHFSHYHGGWLQQIMREHLLLNKVDDMPYAWKESMLISFLRACVMWWKKKKNVRVTNHGKLTGITDKSRWRLEETFKYERFEGIYQMQHCEVEITYCYGKDDDAAQFVFKCIDLLCERPVEITHNDIDPTLFKFALLKKQLAKMPMLPGNTPEERQANVELLNIRWESKPGNWSYIYNDQRLRTAMLNGRTKNNHQIELMVLSPDQVNREFWISFLFSNMSQMKLVSDLEKPSSGKRVRDLGESGEFEASANVGETGGLAKRRRRGVAKK